MKEKGLHDGHRERVRKRFMENGLDGFFDHQVLELMLFYCIPRKDTNDMAHILLNKFGSFSAVLDAPFESLLDCGISSNAAVFIKLIPSLCSRYYQDSYHQKNDDSKSMEEFILPHFIGQNEEQLFLVLLDAKGKRVFSHVVSRGTKSEASVNIQKIVQLGVQHDASCAIVAHNHPNGVNLPSKNDIDMTLRLQRALRNVGIVLFDHYIITGMECHSIFHMKKYKHLFS